MPWTDLTKGSSSFLTEGEGWFYSGWFSDWFGGNRATSDWAEITKL